MSNVEPVTTLPGLNRPSFNPCLLLDFAYLALDEGVRYESFTENREYLVVILGGRGTFAVNNAEFTYVGGRPNVFAGGPHAVYLPCHAAYGITAHGRLDVALVSAPSDVPLSPYVITPDRVTARACGAANFSSACNQILTLESQPDLPARRLIVGETFIPSGNWSFYPPHRHEKDDLPQEAFHEELCFFRLNPPDGFGLVRYYDDDRDSAYVIGDRTLLMAPRGYHTVVGAPGYTTYCLWALAGNLRVQASREDPVLSWVARTVPMLRALER